MLRQAFNLLAQMHSRPAQLKRLGSPDIYSPCRIVPSNYFKSRNGPENTAFFGREFVIPLDSLLGEIAQVITFSAVPADGDFKLKYGASETDAILFSASASDVQAALRLIPGLSAVEVTGSFSMGFTVIFHGLSTALLS